MNLFLENLRLLTAPDAMTVEQRAAAAALEPYYERAKAAFGLDFANEFWEKQARANELDWRRPLTGGSDWGAAWPWNYAGRNRVSYSVFWLSRYSS